MASTYLVKWRPIRAEPLVRIGRTWNKLRADNCDKMKMYYCGHSVTGTLRQNMVRSCQWHWDCSTLCWEALLTVSLRTLWTKYHRWQDRPTSLWWLYRTRREEFDSAHGAHCLHAKAATLKQFWEVWIACVSKYRRVWCFWTCIKLTCRQKEQAWSVDGGFTLNTTQAITQCAMVFFID